MQHFREFPLSSWYMHVLLLLSPTYTVIIIHMNTYFNRLIYATIYLNTIYPGMHNTWSSI